MTRRRLIQVLGVGSALALVEACGPAAPAVTTATSAPAATSKPAAPTDRPRGADGCTNASANRCAGHGRRRQADRRRAGRAAHLHSEREGSKAGFSQQRTALRGRLQHVSGQSRQSQSGDAAGQRRQSRHLHDGVSCPCRRIRSTRTRPGRKSIASSTRRSTSTPSARPTFRPSSPR